MAFVAVVYVFLYSQTVEHDNTPDTQHIFLFHTVFPIATIQLVCNRTVKFTILFKVGIHQIKLDAPDIDFPNICINNTSRERYFKYHRMSILIKNLLYGQLVKILWLIIGQLLPIHRQSLGEVTIAIKETYPCHVYIPVTGFFQIISRQYTESTRIYFQNISQTIFHTEISNGRNIFSLFNIHVFFEIVIDVIDMAHHRLVSCYLFKAFIAYTLK